MYPDVIFTMLSWTIYFFLHSALASITFKTWLKENLPNLSKYHRLIYTAISSFGLLPILYFLATTASSFMLERTTFLKYIGLMLATWGIIMLKAAFKNYNTKEFLGLAFQERKPKFIRHGLLNYVRHPIYTGTILFIIGFWFFIPNILNGITVLCFFIYLAIGIRLEEHKLMEEFGDIYIKYKQEVPMLFPDMMAWIRKKTKQKH